MGVISFELAKKFAEGRKTYLTAFTHEASSTRSAARVSIDGYTPFLRGRIARRTRRRPILKGFFISSYFIIAGRSTGHSRLILWKEGYGRTRSRLPPAFCLGIIGTTKTSPRAAANLSVDERLNNNEPQRAGLAAQICDDCCRESAFWLKNWTSALACGFGAYTSAVFFRPSCLPGAFTPMSAADAKPLRGANALVIVQMVRLSLSPVDLLITDGAPTGEWRAAAN